MSRILTAAIEIIAGSLRQLFRRPDWFARVNKQSMADDAFAGLTGATIVLPQGIAFAAIAGLPPEYGFYTAMITPIVAALFGSSWHTVSGPTTAISALVFGALSGLYALGSAEFIQAAITLALLVGIFQWVLGLARLGALVDFVSHSVMTGFITGAALLIGLTQIKH
ncbi:MAG: SulP family inorganic anion transporter, partial [Hyphomicrobiales bacterium]